MTNPKYRADIDGLRAIAVIFVVGFHAFPEQIPGGFVGVDVFFVISGFLISTIIFGGLENDSFTYSEFYARRIRRIFPALILVLSATAIFGWYELLADEYKQLGKHIAAGVGFVSNFAFWSEAGYFDNIAETKPLLHLWSLGIEEQFYLIWPALLLTAWQRRLNFLPIIVGIAIVSFGANIYLAKTNATAAFYSPASRFWELMLGGMLAYVSLHRPAYLPKTSNWQSIVGLALIVFTGAFFNHDCLHSHRYLRLLPQPNCRPPIITQSENKTRRAERTRERRLLRLSICRPHTRVGVMAFGALGVSP